MTPAGFLTRYADRAERRLIGLMSGTSVDGIDVASVKISGSRRATVATLESFHSHPWPSRLRARILAVSHGSGGGEEISRLNFEIAEQLALAARLAMGDRPVDAIASHGQTVSHTAPHATLQLGNPAVLAARLGVPVVSDFRSADIARGGQGAPLVPYADWCLLTDPSKTRAVQNLGGIGNVTYLPASADSEKVIGFDTGPGNMLIDLAASWSTGGEKTFDEGGSLAARGKVDFDLLEFLYRHPFLSKSPPKSAGREEFGQGLFDALIHRIGGVSLDDPLSELLSDARIRTPIENYSLVATVTDFTALSIADAYHRFLPSVPDEVILCGGGARNPFLVERMRERLPNSKMLFSEDVGIDGDAKEAIAFAILANETLLGQTASLPSVTGASAPAILGSLTFP